VSTSSWTVIEPGRSGCLSEVRPQGCNDEPGRWRFHIELSMLGLGSWNLGGVMFSGDMKGSGIPPMVSLEDETEVCAADES